MNTLSGLSMIFGTLVLIPYVLGKDAIDDIEEAFNKIFDHPNMNFMLSIGFARTSLSILLTIGSSIFWYYWSVSTLKNEISLLVVYFLSMISMGLLYLTYQYLINSPSNNNSTHTTIITYIVLSVALLGSIGIIWIPTVVFLASRVWRLLAYMPLFVSGISGYILFMAGLFLFVITNH